MSRIRRGRPAPLWVVGMAALLSGCSDADPLEPTPGGPQVAEVVPRPHARAAAAGGEVVARFDRALDPTSVDADAVQVFGRWSGVIPGSVTLEDADRTLRFTPARPLAAGEWVSVQIPADRVRDQDGEALRSGFAWSFWTAAAPASLDPTFAEQIPVRRPGEGHIQTYGAYAGDLNGDGWSDLVVPNEQSADLRIFLNDGTGGYGGFSVVPLPGADDPSTNEGADFNGDGHIDIAVGSARGDKVHVLFGDGRGGLVLGPVLTVGMIVRGVCVLDLEGDGNPDLAATAFAGQEVVWFRNDGSGAFQEAGRAAAGQGPWACATADMDGDGLRDLIVGSRGSLDVHVFLNVGDGTLDSLSPVPAGGDPWMFASGDMDGDGRADIVSVGAQAGTVDVLFGDGTGAVSLEQSLTVGGFPLAVDLGDLDGDGDLDVVVSDYAAAAFSVLENDGSGQVNRRTHILQAPRAGSCAILHDRDGDGDLDITGIDEEDDVLLLFVNGG